MTQDDAARVRNYLIRLVEKSPEVEMKRLPEHWMLVSSVAALLCQAYISLNEKARKPQITISPKETDEDVRLP